MVFDNPHALILPVADSITYTLFSVFLISLCVLILTCIYREQSPNENWYTVEDDEYNFLADENSEQSRLDLAAVYIEIHQHQDAKTLLKELLNSQNPITKEKAKQLLKNIKA